jgi:hypothetical protein
LLPDAVGVDTFVVRLVLAWNPTQLLMCVRMIPHSTS